MRRSLEDLIANADALADRFENFDPQPGERDAPMPPLLGLKLAAWKRNMAEKDLAVAVHAAREQSISWRKIGEEIGTSGEAARQRYADAS